jgi:hypothetical protein
MPDAASSRSRVAESPTKGGSSTTGRTLPTSRLATIAQITCGRCKADRPDEMP